MKEIKKWQFEGCYRGKVVGQKTTWTFHPVSRKVKGEMTFQHTEAIQWRNELDSQLKT